SNDFQIPQALAVTWEMIKSNIPSQDKLALLYEFDQVFGLKLQDLREEKIPEEIIKLVGAREEERKKGDFKKADELRTQIESKGYTLEDTSQGTVIKRK
ncbi:cysteine--tRNA ligase, partial [Candidatus Roizmanbacteria bacterium]|nr:cysteine--tRNA ligase [Candidatus Roizmanbacteria bacterium]